jgi:hypothetical protein
VVAATVALILVGFARGGRWCVFREWVASLVDHFRTAFAMRSAGQPLDLQLHQALGGEANHLA